MSRQSQSSKNSAAEAQMQQLARDFENIDLMNSIGKKDSIEARRKSAQALPKRAKQSHYP